MILIVLKHFLKHIFLDRHFHVCFYSFYTFFLYFLVVKLYIYIYTLFDILLVLLYSALDHIHMHFALYKYKFINVDVESTLA